MKGFFEFQYLSYKKQHMMNLIALARTDGDFHEKEMEILYKIGKKYKLKTRHIDVLLSSEDEVRSHLPNNHDQCMEQIYDLVAMMLADNVIADSEIKFCTNMIQSMGYKTTVLQKFIEYVQLGLNDHESWDQFKNEAMNDKINGTTVQPN